MALALARAVTNAARQSHPLVIYGKFTGSPTGTRCLHGGGGSCCRSSRTTISSTSSRSRSKSRSRALSIENIRVNVPSVFTVAVGTDIQTMQNAAIRLLGLGVPEIKQQAGDIIFGQLRQVIASMGIEDISATATSSCTTSRRRSNRSSRRSAWC